MEERGQVVDALQSMPYHDDETIWYLDAFFMLSSSRQVGMGMGAIPISEILAYGHSFEILNDLKTFVTVIQGMDSVYMNHVNETNNKKQPTHKKK